MPTGTENNAEIVWWVRCGDDLVGSLSSPTADQPWTIAHFQPAAAWERVRALFEAQTEARRQGFPREQVGALKAVKELHVELQPVGEGETIKPVLIYIEAHEARFRS
ncbi:hypothetical protein [Streptomyces sp. NRRL S-118]|uniref:hypothetical protein n=1 Tax=Streptomyces sp. NRRL S-118 TaxID=1463881 RepID=UPI00131D1BD4|nr:hypothetical protein [Streptomyces sp. NRRL S-118]